MRTSRHDAFMPEVLALLNGGATYRSISEATGIPLGSLPWLVARHNAKVEEPGKPVVEKAKPEKAEAVAKVAQDVLADAMRTRLLRAIAADGPFATVTDLLKHLRSRDEPATDIHNAAHLLHRLNHAGLIAYRERQTGKDRRLTDLRATARGYEVAQVPRKAVEASPVVVEVVEIATPADLWEPTDESLPVIQAVAEPLPTPLQTYPILEALRERVEHRAQSAIRAARLLEAAALLESVDHEESQRLLVLAEAADGEPFAAVETEYLRYVESHP